MNEFNNRIDAQRQILRLVNQRHGAREELFGLSSKAIDRWIGANQIDPECRLVLLVRDASSKLFFLANKSQEQISPQYQAASAEMSKLTTQIGLEINSWRLEPA
jgi:hypothetical protein